MTHLLIFGLGYSGAACARAAAALGMPVVATSRTRGRTLAANVAVIPFDDAAASVARATHILATAPPGDAGDPVLARYAESIAAAPSLRWIGYLSTTGVYGDRQGGTVDETTVPAPGSARSRRRLAAEESWRAAAAGRKLDLIRLAGIYGPGRSQLDDVRHGQARRVLAPGHKFGRIHVDDIAGGVMAAIARPPEGTRVLNFSDDLPAESADVVAEAAMLLGADMPVGVELSAAWPGMSEMARSFWAENRVVDSAATQAALGYRWHYPSYREGLRAILAAERAKKRAGETA